MSQFEQLDENVFALPIEPCAWCGVRPRPKEIVVRDKAGDGKLYHAEYCWAEEVKCRLYVEEGPQDYPPGA